MNPNHKRNITAAGIDKISTFAGPSNVDETLQLIERAKAICKEAANELRPFLILQQANPNDREIAERISAELFKRFDSWSKEELLYLTVFLHTELIMK